MTRLIAVKCPECGADLQIEEGRKIAYCTYCGAKVLIDNENEHIYRHIDDADIKRAEAEERIRMRELDMEQAEVESGKSRTVLWALAVIACIVMMVIGVLIDQMMLTVIFMPITMWVGLAAYQDIENARTEKHDRMERRQGKLKMPMLVAGYEGQYTSLERAIRNEGFHNVSSVNQHDITFGLIKKPGTVTGVTVDGEDALAGKWYYPDTEIVISYHGR